MFKRVHLKVSSAVAAALMLGTLLVTALPVSAAVCSVNTTASDLCFDGSTTVFPVVTVSITRFPASFPGTTMNDGVFPGTGSGHGQSSLFGHVVDIAMSSGTCNNANFGANGIPGDAGLACATFVDTIFAKDALTVIANKNFVTGNGAGQCNIGASPTLSKLDVQKIWEGVALHWGDLSAFASAPTACKNTAIVPRARIIGSGTRASFVKLAGIYCTDTSDCASTPISGGLSENQVINNTGLARLLGNPEVEQAIDTNPGQIGYIGLAFTDANNIQFCIDGGSGPICPSVSTVSNLTYPYSRNLHLFTIAPGTVYTDTTGLHTFAQKQRVNDYLNWIVADEGQQLVQQIGFVPISAIRPTWDVNGDHTADILDFAQTGNFWGQTAPPSGDVNDPLLRGWVAADANWDGTIDILDFATIGNHWGQTW